VNSSWDNKSNFTNIGMSHKLISLFALVLLGAVVSSCCEPKSKDSFPFVIDSSYADTAIYDQYLFGLNEGGLPPDSGFRPVYSLDIKNTGSEADTFTLRYSRIGNGFLIPIEVKKFVPPGQTVTFTTRNDFSDTSDISSSLYYGSFFVLTRDSITITRMRPSVTITYGGIDNGPEECNTAPSTIDVDVLSLRRKD